MDRESQYLGDGVEATFDGWMLKLTADGSKVVYLEPSVFYELVRYGRRCWPDMKLPPGA